MTLALPLDNLHVSLEPLEERHREPLRKAAADPDLWRWSLVNMHGGSHGGTFDTWFDQRLKGRDEASEAPWAVFDKATWSFAGSTSFLAVNLPHKKVEVGATWYAKSFWAGPVNPSCKRLLFTHGFETLELNRIELKLDATNIRSFRAVARLGARFEGIHRAHFVMPDGRIRDTAWFSILREEWRGVRAGLDARLAAFDAR